MNISYNPKVRRTKSRNVVKNRYGTIICLILQMATRKQRGLKERIYLLDANFDDKIILSVFDINGRVVDIILSENLKAGYYDVIWNEKAS